MKTFREGQIPYGKTVVENGLTYSIDKFSMDFLFGVDDAAFNLLKATNDLQSFRTLVKPFLVHRFKLEKTVYEYDDCHVELWQQPSPRYMSVVRPDDSGEMETIDHVKVGRDLVTVLRIVWNPNKCGSGGYLDKFFKWVAGTDWDYTWRINRVDYAIDIPGYIHDYYVMSRKTETFYKTTRYYGERHSNGQLRVYDKRLELRTHYGVDIGTEVTRFEWEQIGNTDLAFTFDKFGQFDFDNCTGYAVRMLKYVQPELINNALGSLDKRTRYALKEEGFIEIPIDRSIFQMLLDSYLADYCLPRVRRQNPVAIPAL